MATSAASTRLRLRVTTAAESAVRSGHPWVFSDSVQEFNRPGQSGELAVIYDRKDKFLAVGLFDPASPIRVRILHAGKPQTIDAAWWQARLEQTIARRIGLFDAQTTGYRLIHGESDGWPGLVLDRYDTTLALKLYTAAWLPWLDDVLALLKEKIPCERIILRLSRNIQSVLNAPNRAKHTNDREIISHSLRLNPQGQVLPKRGNTFPPLPGGEGRGEGGLLYTHIAPSVGSEGKRDGQMLFGPPPTAPVIFSENGIRFEADVQRGQKTGFFLDQRENRHEVETLAHGRRVLNAFSFSGGFSVYAARGGAVSVTDLDISPHALESARRNFALNKHFPAVAACRHETVQADAFEWIGKAREQFDLIVLDPPSLAKRAAEREGAIRAYERLNSQGIRLLARDGILVAGSCSAHVSAPEFFEAVRLAAMKSGRKFSELKTMLHPPDHPAGFKEAEYLKVIYLKFGS